jgi:outer membrane protein assembly factor BamD
MRKIMLLFCLVTMLFACNGYQKLLKSTDFELKYKKAVEYYEKDDYSRALPLFEELLTVFRGTEKGESVYFYYAYCNYYTDDFMLAAYHFKNLAKTFPHGKHAEEALYMNAFCYYLNSPAYSLDQSNTYSALSEFQLFLNQYPKSEKIPECNTITDKLRDKLEAKAFYNSKLYYNTEYYGAAIVAFGNMLKDFPDTKYREEAHYIILKSHYLLAVKSIEEKKEGRIQNTIDFYRKFASTFPKSRYSREAENMYASIKRISKKMKK